MDLNSTQIFVCVVQEQGFTAAAERLNVSKQMVSRKVAELEKDLGSRLLERSTRKLRLTSSGELFYKYAFQITSLAQEATNSLRQTQQEPQGRLRIVAPQLFGDLVLRHVISDYMKKYPKVKVSALFSQATNDLYDDNIDISIQAGPLKNSSLIAKRIAPAWFSCYAAPALFNNKKIPTHPDDIKDIPLIHYNEPVSGLNDHWYFHHQQQSTVEIRLQPTLQTNSFWLAREATIKGVGIARLPSSLCIGDLKEKLLIPILAEWNCSNGPLYAVFPSRKMMGVHIRVFLEMLEEYLNVPSNSYQNSPLPALIQEVPQLVEPNLWHPEE